MVIHTLVSIVDDDQSVRESLPDLLREFGCGPAVLVYGRVPRLRLGGPDQMFTAHRDEIVRPRLLEQDAVECLFKPFSDTALLKVLTDALRMT
jgi:FixJ family two-component response regulator